MSLREIGLRYKTQKAGGNCTFAEWNYLDIYERYICPDAMFDKAFIEIGVKQGFSLQMWREYLPKSVVIGIDNNPACADICEGIVIGNQAAQATADDALTLLDGMELGAVVDDGSHINTLTIASFRLFWPMLAPGGVYIIEDLANSYTVELEKDMRRGHWFPKGGVPDGVRLENHREDIQALFNELVSGLDHREGDVLTIHFWSQLVVIQKRSDV